MFLKVPLNRSITPDASGWYGLWILGDTPMWRSPGSYPPQCWVLNWRQHFGFQDSSDSKNTIRLNSSNSKPTLIAHVAATRRVRHRPIMIRAACHAAEETRGCGHWTHSPFSPLFWCVQNTLEVTPPNLKEVDKIWSHYTEYNTSKQTQLYFTQRTNDK